MIRAWAKCAWKSVASSREVRCGTAAADSAAPRSLRSTRSSIALDAMSYRSETFAGIVSPRASPSCRLWKMEMHIESISGLFVTRLPVCASRGTRSRTYFASSEDLSPLPMRRSITSSCCSSLSGSSLTCRKCSLKSSSCMPFGRDVTSMTWPCGASTCVTCRSIASRFLPPSSIPSSRMRARRAISAWRSMRYGAESMPCTHCRKASTQFQDLANTS
mmetsp:Transcript_33571/g.75970  ORF Transcript_33571/g.75970 Transcript_33571/m.75970 type:complete len:218 (-) Transcript_33571:61-714(-)